MYDEAVLAAVNVRSPEWAHSMARSILNDTTTPYRYSDAEVDTHLALHEFVHDGVTFYRPHVAAAAMIQGDPDRATSISIDNASESRESPRTAASRIRREYVAIDKRIAAEAGVHPDPAPGEAQVMF